MLQRSLKQDQNNIIQKISITRWDKIVISYNATALTGDSQPYCSTTDCWKLYSYKIWFHCDKAFYPPSCNSFWLQIVSIHYFSQQYYYTAFCRLTVYNKPQLIMEYRNSVEAKQGTERSELVLPKSFHDDTMRYSIPIQAEDDGRNSILVASVVHLNNTR